MKINEVTDVEKKFDKKPFDVYTPRIAELADKYNVSTEELMKQVQLGVKVEAEHVTEFAVALEIALDHIAEKLDYYEELAKVEHESLSEWSADEKEELQQIGHWAEMIAAGDKMAAAKLGDYIDNNFINIDSDKLVDRIRTLDADQIYSLARSLVRNGKRAYNEDAIVRGSEEHNAYIAKKRELESQIYDLIVGDPNAEGYTWDQFQTAMKDPEKKAAYDKLKSEVNALVKGTVIKNAPKPSSDNGTAGRYPDAEPGKRYMGDDIEERSTGAAIKTSVGKMLNKKNYAAAVEYMKKSGKNAADVARMFKGVDARELAAMTETTTAGAIATSTGAGNGFVGGGPGTLSRAGAKKKKTKKR